MVKFGTLEFYKTYADALNNDETFAKSGITFTHLYIFTDRLGVDGQPKCFLLTVDKGKSTVNEAKASDIDKYEFAQTGTYDLLASIAKGDVSAQKAKLKLNMMKAMKEQKTLYRMASVSKEIKGVEY